MSDFYVESIFADDSLQTEVDFSAIRGKNIQDMSEEDLLAYYVFLKNTPIDLLPDEEYSSCIYELLKLKVDLTAVDTKSPSVTSTKHTEHQSRIRHFQNAFFERLCPVAVEILELRVQVDAVRKTIPKTVSALRSTATAFRKLQTASKRLQTQLRRVRTKSQKHLVRLEKKRAQAEKKAAKAKKDAKRPQQQNLFS